MPRSGTLGSAHYYFFGTGSGIAPLYAMIRSVLSSEPHSVVHLIYGNLNAQAIIFRDSRIHAESYGVVEPPDDSVAGVTVEATMWLNGKELPVEVPAGQILLNKVPAARGTPSYSCASGMCGTCRVRLYCGSVHMWARTALSDAEVARGAILTCPGPARDAAHHRGIPEHSRRYSLWFRPELLQRDTAQALGKLPKLPRRPDLVTLSSHKVHGPQGIGALLLRRGPKPEALLRGGGQQQGLRSGTLPTPCVSGSGLAVPPPRPRSLGILIGLRT